MDKEKNSVWRLVDDLNTKKGITEIIINDPKRTFVERGGQFIQLNTDLSKADLYEFSKDVAKFNKKHFDPSHPILDGNLPDGSRINVIAEPFAMGSPAITIRKYLQTIKSFDDGPEHFKLTPQWIDFFKSLVKSKMNIIVSGGTGVGKTTFVNLLLNELSPAERVVTIEDSIELSLSIPNTVRLEVGAKTSGKETTFLSARDLVKNTLRMRPDRIIIGEVRGGELFELLQAMNTGHDGSMSTIHANSPADCLSRMENLFLMAGFDLPFQVVRKQLAYGVDFIIQLGKNRNGEREVSSVMELTGMEGNNILSQVILQREEGKLLSTGVTPKNMRRLHEEASLPLDFFN